MSAVGVLPFVRGIDLTSYDFKGGQFPKKTENMSGLQWLKLDKTNLCYLPEELVKLKKLEEISVSNNQLTSLHGDLGALTRLKSIRASRNKLKDASIPQHIFELEDLSVLDLSHNNLTIIPPDLENSKNILVLNLGHNEISSIPVQLFINLSDLLHLDMSNNQLETLPPQMRRLVHLKVLILNNNPLLHAQLRQLPSMVQLTTLHLQNTQRTISNFPSNLSTLRQLSDVDLSCNELSRVPDALYSISTLKRLNLSNNQIDELSLLIDGWNKLETLNLSNNLLTSLPTSICKLQCLRRLFVNDNKLDFEGIPASIGKLANLECFSAASNSIEIVPESLCRCMKLRKLILTNNRLSSIPQSIHNLSELQTLDVRGNSDVEIPPKPTQVDKASNDTLYNVDFSLKHQYQKLGASANSDASEPASPSSKDPVTRKMRMKRRREADLKAQQVLKGMTDVAEGKQNNQHDNDSMDDTEGLDSASMKGGKKWNESLNKPDLDYGEIFTAEVGQFPGLTVWQIDNLYPSIIEDMSLYGKFYIGDCYIILNTIMDDSSNLSWEIYFWIGQDASIDKKACSAIHAVNLRNMLGATGRTIREEMNDESDEFLNLFENSVSYIEGGNLSGFYTVEDKVYSTKLYAFYGKRNVTPYPVPLQTSSLNPNEVLLLDKGKIIYVWAGSNTQTVKRSKARLIAEKINKDERKNEADIILQDQGYEDMEFWQIFGGLPDEVEAEELTVYRHKHPRLYRVNLGMGYLELPQVRYQLATEHDNKINSKNDVHPKSRLLPYLLDTKNVYILDTYTNVYIWVGRKSTRLVRAAAGKLAFEIAAMMDRPSFSSVTKEVEGHESVIFKSNFKGWTDVVKVDYTKSQEPLHLVDVKKNDTEDEKKKKANKQTADVQAIFAPRQQPMPFDEAKQLMKDWNEDLEMMQGFVLHGKKFVPLPQEEFGRFYSQDCCVFLCRYWVPVEEEDSVDSDADDDESQSNDAVHYILYFWQGRDATNMGWLTFTFTLQPKFEKAFPGKLEVLKMKQQQENLKFLSHFKQKFFVTNGTRKEAKVNQYKDKTQFYQIRSNGSYLTTRCIEIEANPQLLNSQFCYILKVPFNSEEMNGIVYAWIGRIADVNESRLAEELATSMFSQSYSVQIIYEGEEPENFFWVALGGRPQQQYDEDADYLDHCRLFRCSNDKGFFCVSEKCADFCQTDLADDDIMILDNGTSVYMWVGTQTSETETQFGLKTTMLYIKHMKSKGLVRKLKLVRKGNEPFEFTRCFHAWYSFPKP